MKTGLDTSVIVHILRERSPEHEASWAWYRSQREGGGEVVIADHALLEAFSVLSRTPPPFRLSPHEAERVLQEHFGSAIIAPIWSGFAWKTIRHTVAQGFGGGRVYDAAIALAVYEAGARLLLTWNVGHFISVAPVGLEIRHP